MPQKPDATKTPEEQLAELQAQLEKANKSIEKLTGERDAYRGDLDQAMKLVRLDTPDDEALAALRYTMQKAGYSHAEIEEYVRAQTEPAPTPKTQPRERTPSTDGYRDQPDPSNNDVLLEGLREVLGVFAKRLDTIEGTVQQSNMRATRMTAADLRSRIDEQVSTAIDSDKTLATILKRIDGEGKTKARDSLSKELLLQTKELLRETAKNQRELTPDVVKEVVKKATEEVGTRYRTVIGDPSTLGRTPETVAEQQRFLNEKPVEAPDFNPETDTLSDIRAKSREWGADVLSRDVAKASTEESVV